MKELAWLFALITIFVIWTFPIIIAFVEHNFWLIFLYFVWWIPAYLISALIISILDNFT